MARFGWRFLTSEAWNPVTETTARASSIFGTLVSTAIAMVLAVPLSLVTALFLVDLAPPTLGRFVGTALELLAAMPSIIFGMWGLFVFAPFMAKYVQPLWPEPGLPAPVPFSGRRWASACSRPGSFWP